MRFALLFALSATLLSAQTQTNVARNTFAQLLKISVESPNVTVTVHKRREEDGLILEDISWKSRDGETVPAWVIRPAGASGPLPAVICLHGSSGGRDSMVTEQFGPGEWTRYGRDTTHTRMLGWARELARRGYLALAMTQRGLDNRGPAINTQANVMLVQGRTAMGEILQEIRQAVTYLESRDDTGKIGATGMSFGGITSFYSWLLDPRITAAAPICGGVGSLESFIAEGSLAYHGTYWWVPGMLEYGDHGDFAAPMAPRPLMVWAPTEDIGMPRAGVDRFRERVTPAYRQSAAPEALQIHQQPGEHSFTLAAFDAMDQFFRRWLE